MSRPRRPHPLQGGPRSGAIARSYDWWDNSNSWWDNSNSWWDDEPEYPSVQAEQEADDARDPRYDLDAAEEMEVEAEEMGP